MKSYAMKRPIAVCFATFLLVMTLAATPAGAGEKVELEGTIKGAKCTHYKKECVNNDKFIDLEPDFVFVLPSGEYYFIPNLSRSVKVRHAYSRVVIHGERTGQEIWVDRLDDLDDAFHLRRRRRDQNDVRREG